MRKIDQTAEAMNRLARSSWGKQGIGACPNRKMRERLITLGVARPVKGESERILALTLKGFRELEAKRWRLQ